MFLEPHDVWQVNASNATVLAAGDNYPYITLNQYGKGYIIYDCAFQPVIGHGGFAPGMYAYMIFRRSVEWAFQSANLPVPKLSPWPYEYDAAFMERHDLENYTNEIESILSSAQVEWSNNVKGDYYFWTGQLREDMYNLTNTNTVINNLRLAVSTYGASIGPHNGGLRNQDNYDGLTETLGSASTYDYWHWGQDELLDFPGPAIRGGAGARDDVTYCSSARDRREQPARRSSTGCSATPRWSSMVQPHTISTRSMRERSENWAPLSCRPARMPAPAPAARYQGDTGTGGWICSRRHSGTPSLFVRNQVTACHRRCRLLCRV